MKTLYRIMKMSKVDKSAKWFLSPKKKRWLQVRTSKHQFGKFTESEVDKYIKQKGDDADYYYLKTLI